MIDTVKLTKKQPRLGRRPMGRPPACWTDDIIVMVAGKRWMRLVGDREWKRLYSVEGGRELII